MKTFLINYLIFAIPLLGFSQSNFFNLTIVQNENISDHAHIVVFNVMSGKIQCGELRSSPLIFKIRKENPRKVELEIRVYRVDSKPVTYYIVAKEDITFEVKLERNTPVFKNSMVDNNRYIHLALSKIKEKKYKDALDVYHTEQIIHINGLDSLYSERHENDQTLDLQILEKQKEYLLEFSRVVKLLNNDNKRNLIVSYIKATKIKKNSFVVDFKLMDRKNVYQKNDSILLEVTAFEIIKGGITRVMATNNHNDKWYFEGITTDLCSIRIDGYLQRNTNPVLIKIYYNSTLIGSDVLFIKKRNELH